MRVRENDIELRKSINDITIKYRADLEPLFFRHAGQVNYNIVKDEIRDLWKTFFSSGEENESDHDVLGALKAIPFPFWPEDLYLQASLYISKALHCPVVAKIDTERLNADSRFLMKYLKNITSRDGEDGVIHQIFEIMGVNNPWCVEFGAWDGKYLSNTYDLIAHKDWNGVLIEMSKDRFEDLKETYKGNDKAHLINQMIGFDAQSDSIDFILGKTDIPQNLDLMSIDIDGNDWHVWDSMQTYRPRLVLIEFNPSIPNDVLYIQERNFEQQRGCSLRALIELGKLKGYELVCATAINGLFVVSEEFDKFGISDNSIDAMYTPVVDGRIFHGYDSSIHVIGMQKLLWNWYGHGTDWDRNLPDLINVHKER
jgi:hypothetical protein